MMGSHRSAHAGWKLPCSRRSGAPPVLRPLDRIPLASPAASPALAGLSMTAERRRAGGSNQTSARPFGRRPSACAACSSLGAAQSPTPPGGVRSAALPPRCRRRRRLCCCFDCRAPSTSSLGRSWTEFSVRSACCRCLSSSSGSRTSAPRQFRNTTDCARSALRAALSERCTRWCSLRSAGSSAADARWTDSTICWKRAEALASSSVREATGPAQPGQCHVPPSIPLNARSTVPSVHVSTPSILPLPHVSVRKRGSAAEGSVDRSKVPASSTASSSLSACDSANGVRGRLCTREQCIQKPAAAVGRGGGATTSIGRWLSRDDVAEIELGSHVALAPATTARPPLRVGAERAAAQPSHRSSGGCGA